MSKYVYTSCYLNIIIFCLANMKIQHINVFSALFTVKVFKYAAFTIDEFYNQKHVDFSFNKKYNGTFLLKNIHTSSLPFIFCFFLEDAARWQMQSGAPNILIRYSGFLPITFALFFVFVYYQVLHSVYEIFCSVLMHCNQRRMFFK